MNITRDYNDELEGDFLACRPGHVAEGLEFVCTIGFPILGSTGLIFALWCPYTVYIQRRHRKLVARQTEGVLEVPNARNSREGHSQRDNTATFSNEEKLLLSGSVLIVATSLNRLVNGAGTMYPSTHIRGQIGDVAGKKETK